MTRLLALTRRGLLHAASYRLSFFGNYLGAALVLIFYRVLAEFYGAAQPAALAAYGGDYFTFLLIGGVLARFFSLGLKQFARELEHELTAGTLEPVLATAAPPTLALLGPALWTFLEGLLIAAAQLAAGALLLGADFSRADWPAALALGALTLLALSGWGLLAAAFVLVFKRADPLSWLADVTLYMFAGVYFPIPLLPAVLRPFAYALPLSHALEGLRLALMRGEPLAGLGRYLLILLAFSAALVPLGLWALRAGLRHVRRTGSLGHY
ncbi:MAG: ABC transporter permease [Anaerolineales bacterium]|nr:ABC transporter permease [Anaerolineales bacterium]